MGRGKDEFLDRYGALRLGESEKQLRSRMSEIDEIMALLKNGLSPLNQIEKYQRRLCELKGISFDDDAEDSGENS